MSPRALTPRPFIRLAAAALAASAFLGACALNTPMPPSMPVTRAENVSDLLHGQVVRHHVALQQLNQID